MTQPTPDTGTLADRLRNLDLHELCEAWSADQIEMTKSSDERYGAAHDAVSTVIDEAIDALAAAEQQTAELTQELARAFVIHCDKLLETTANGDAPDFSQIQLGDLDTATPDELRAEIRRLDHRLRWAYRHNDDNQTASLLGLFEIRKQREEDRAQVDAARAEVAELTQQRDQAVAALANARKTIAHELVAEGERIREAGHFAAAKAFGGAALFVMGDEALAVPVPAGDTSHDETTRLPEPTDWRLADLARQAVATARTRRTPEHVLFVTVLKIFREKVHAENGDHSLLRLKPYALWALGKPAPVAAHAGQDETDQTDQTDWRNWTCRNCGHLGRDHEADECWVQVDGKQCDCDWHELAPDATPAVVPGGGDTA